MFTIKLMSARQDPINQAGPATPVASVRFSTKLVEAAEVDIHCLRPGELYEVATPTEAFYVADRNKPRPEGFADQHFYYEAYIENAVGKTTERVTF
jgi:hypothetical protein